MSTEQTGQDIVIVAAKRTPMGGFQGALSEVASPVLAATAIKGLLAQTGISADSVDEVLMGCVLPAGLGQAPARQATLGAGLPLSVGATTVNKVCGSGMKTVMLAHDLIKAGSSQVVVAGGMENMSRAPYLLDKARSGMRMGHGKVMDHMFLDGLEDAYTGGAMGTFAQKTADDFGLTREQMDAFALSSLEKANAAIQSGAFKDEVVSVTVSARGGDISVDIDEQPGNARPEKIPSLRPAFTKDGTITAANSSSISDGAAALMLMTREKATQLGLTVMATIKGHTTHSQEPSMFTTAPVGAMQKLFEKVQWSKDDVDLYEINEAFAMVTMLAVSELGLDNSKVNVNGGACALGHPIGCSGARLLVTLIYALKARGLKRGVASLCIGGGEATAMAIEVE
ncbi:MULTISPECIES: acetyl-CoA C-acyltransferase [Shewanella]|jgi:acetyl-CoA C-acetyltransferase|uniref:Acetyl-CoA C-acyltransferase n=1 Tax=Shewanella vesiculosa TaxID=518738 RepID=A0ABV0FIY0_9GAMM|nr:MULTISPECIES: acetyl-CoA C-acyltransferase [Shewanella]NCQ46589.1 acetyl-CoA C-acyltransferase [Shewanella frigidimarina]MBB1319992.1 acetyl-CoA C-acyltransferase [Shewanella sp. SR43-8]MBB1387851.1 acetyl-CoA C-acyltransferase [Shewanella sp. SG44-6]NCO72574.1 acetyl-CoA C-acyltransferase [Shewanella vesiculosa]NCP38124.1 acetyl-CoA C-acyltransferase [Shewanella vesiculosa]|tara:strand:- start:3690 stop:4883 length:1194 start_codon:yes stop_codon:yes gene_type:complete